MLLSLYLICLIRSQIIEYRFYQNYGQIIHDYSGNGLFGFNGNSRSTDMRDCTFTDRGAYFGLDSMISIAPISENLYVAYPSTFSVIIWAKSLIIQDLGRLFCRWEANLGLLLFHDLTTNSPILSFMKDNDYRYYYGSSNSFFIDKWTLITFELSSNQQALVYIDNLEAISVTFEDTYIETVLMTAHNLGIDYTDDNNPWIKGFQGFIWYFALFYQIGMKDNYLGSQSSTCIIGNCEPCEISFIFPDLLSGCGPRSNVLIEDSAGIACLDATIPCRGNITIDCKCSTESCEFNSNNECFCIYSPSGRRRAGCWLTTGGQGDCKLDCFKCYDEVSCSACMSFDSDIVNGKCICREGLYSTGQLLDTDSCMLCNSMCKACQDYSSCTKCSDKNTDLIEGKCICKTNYFLSPNTNQCSPCLPICLTCNNSTCTCKVPNSSFSSNDCICDSGFYEYRLSGVLFSCSSCAEVCESCENQVCRCFSGFYFNISINSCSPCKDDCLTCESFNSCLTCRDFSQVPPNCFSCHSSCLTCSGKELFECLSCKDFIMKNVCLKSCPLGYLEREGKCFGIDHDRLVLNFKFEGVSDRFFDQVFNVMAVKRANFYGNLPESALGRGVYFGENSNLEISVLDLFGFDFTISLWVKPLIDSAVLLSRKMNQSHLVLIEFSKSIFSIRLTTNNISQSTSGESFDEKTWNHLYFSNEFTSGSTLSLVLNGKTIKVILISTFPFIDSSEELLLIGSDSEFKSSYKGFIHRFQIFNSVYPKNKLFSGLNCQGCSYCTAEGECNNPCELNQYYLNSDCLNCSSSCNSTCKAQEYCNLCDDSNCSTCSDFQPSSCSVCNENFELKNGSCFKCNDSSYFDITKKTCKSCPSLCSKCKSENDCEKCSKNSIFNQYGVCICEVDYIFNIECILNVFYADLRISQNLDVSLCFTQELKKKLEKDQIQVSLKNKKIKFKVSAVDLKVFKIIFDLDLLDEETQLKIVFNKDIYSKNDTKLFRETLEKVIKLNQQQIEDRDLKKKADGIKSVGRKGVFAGLLITLGAGVISFNFEVFFDFLNTAEIFYSVYLSNIKMNPILREFLLSIRIQKRSPHLISKITGQVYGNDLNKKLQLFGYKTSSFIFNTEPYLQTLCIFISIFLIVRLLMMINTLKPKLASIESHFKFSVFLRFWVQSLLEFLICLRISIFSSTTQTAFEILDFCMSLIIIVRNIQAIESILFLIYLILVSKKSKLESQESHKIFNEKFGTFFIDFKENHYREWFFYLLYILRRVFIVISLEFSSDGLFQLIIPALFALLVKNIQVPLYIAFVQIFKSRISNFYHFFKEALIFFYYFLILFTRVHWDEFSEKMAFACIYIITIAWIMNIVYSVYSSFKKIKEKIQKFLEERKNREKVQPDLKNEGKNITKET